MIHSIIKTWNVTNKRIFVRADLNVPLDNGKIINDFRLTSIQPTLDYIIQHNGSIVLATHIGRPQDHEPELSTQLLMPWFEQRGYSIQFVQDINTIAHYPIIPKQILLIENLRFFPGEKNGDPFFAKQLANSSSYYINDAFGVVHRNDCSVTLLPYEFTDNRRSIGFLIEKELRMLNALRDNPKHPFVAILGGGKIEDKIPLIHGLLNTVDTVLLCPALCFSLLKSLGQPVGKSLVNDSTLTMCKKIIIEAQNSGVTFLFPIDYQVADNTIDGPLSVVTASDFPDNAVGISIGPKTVELFTNEINQAQTIFLNCAMGFSDRPETRQSTYSIIKAMAHTQATTVIAGGDSVDAALNSGSAASIDHLSIGGGAALAYLSGNLLPGLTAFEEK
jgi:phosphoglycerate kinase